MRLIDALSVLVERRATYRAPQGQGTSPQRGAAVLPVEPCHAGHRQRSWDTLPLAPMVPCTVVSVEGSYTHAHFKEEGKVLQVRILSREHSERPR